MPLQAPPTGPAILERPRPRPEASAVHPPATGHPQALRIGIIDDSPADRALIAAALRRLHRPTTIFESDGAQALTPEQLAPLDVLVADHFLATRTSFEVIHDARQVRPELPIVVISGFESPGLTLTLVKAGASAVLGKWEIDNLGPTLDAVLDAKQPTPSSSALLMEHFASATVGRQETNFAVLDQQGKVCAQYGHTDAGPAAIIWEQKRALVAALAHNALYSNKLQNARTQDGDRIIDLVVWPVDPAVFGGPLAALATPAARGPPDDRDDWLDTLRSVGHDLGNLGAMIGLQLHLLAQSDLPTDAQKHLRSLHATNQRMTTLLRSTVDMARLGSGPMEFVVTHGSVAKFAREVHAAYTDIATTDRRRFLVHAETDASWTGDWLRLSQIVFNLLDNAIKYSPEGLIIVRFRCNALGLMVMVEDTGVGLTEQEREQIFDLFSRADSGRSVATGYGIGLHHVRALTKRMGGALEVFSDGPGKGTRFTVIIPDMGALATPQIAGLPPGVKRVDDPPRDANKPPAVVDHQATKEDPTHRGTAHATQASPQHQLPNGSLPPDPHDRLKRGRPHA